MDTIRFAIIGCGKIAPKHVRAIQAVEGASLVAVCDINESKAKSFGEEHQVSYFSDYHQVLALPDLDIVCICTPSGSHAEITLAAAKAKKHVITEKPMAMNLTEADAMINACKEQGVKLFVVKQNRYQPPIIKLKKAFDQGRFGKLFLGNVTVRWSRPQAYYDEDKWRGTQAKDGGVLMNQASHHIDLLRWLLGPVESVVAKKGTFTHQIESEDLGVALIKFKNGALGVIEATTCIFPKNLEGSLSLFGSKGSVKVGGTAVNKLITWDFKDFTNDDALIQQTLASPPIIFASGHIDFMKDVIASLKNNTVPFIDGEEGRKTLVLIQALYQSAETGKEVFLDEGAT